MGAIFMPYKDPEAAKAHARRYMKQYYATRPEKRAKKLEYDRKNNRIKKLREYGLNHETFNLLVISQNKLCAICFQELQTNKHNTLARTCIDHNHHTGKVRGLLCGRCNLLLGNARDNPLILDNAKNYLLKHQA